MLDSPSDDDICICENCMELYFDRHKIDVLTNDVLDDLNTLYVELQQDLEKCEDQETRDLKFQKLLVKLEAIENAVVYIHNDLKDENNLLENLDSNFGISVQIESLAEDLETQKKMHDNLRIEWYSQEEHLSRLVDKVHIQDTALENQSIYCTTQGFTLSKMLWKISNRNELLDQILLNEILTQGIFQTFKNCLEAFTLTYRGNMPKPSSPEYQYILSLAGTISNVSAVPDGRFFIINHVVGETVFNEIINSLPKIRAPNAESLKWIMLTVIHNMLVCKEGEEYAKQNQLLLSNVIKCTNKPNSERIIILALKILASLTTGVSNEMYMDHIMKSVPVKGLKQLKKSGGSSKVSKHATCVLSSIMKINQNYRNMENEKLIRTTKLNDSRSSCMVKHKPSRSSQDKSCFCSEVHKSKDSRSSSTVRLQTTKHSQDKACSCGNKIKHKKSSCTVKSQKTRSSQSKTCGSSDVNKLKDRRSSSTVQPSKPSGSSQIDKCCCCPVNKTIESRSRSRSSSAVRRKSSKPSGSSQANTCCCCPVNKINNGRSSSTVGPNLSRPSRSSKVNTCCCPINNVNGGRSSSTAGPNSSRPSRSSQVNTCCCPINNVNSGRSSSTAGPNSFRPSRSSQVNTCCCCPVNNINGIRSSSTVRSKPSKRPKSSQHNTCCCYVNKIKKYISNENLSSTSVSDIDENNINNYTSSIFSKHPTQSSITIMSIDTNFGSQSSSLCFCSSDLTNTSFDKNKARHKKKQFYTGATNSVTCRAPQLNLTIQFKAVSSTSSTDENSLSRDISLNLDFDPIRDPSYTVADKEVPKSVEHESTKCIECSREEIAGTSTNADEVKNELTNSEHDEVKNDSTNADDN